MGDPPRTVLAEPGRANACSNAGASGLLGAAEMAPAEMAEQIGAIRKRTERAFGDNFRMFQPGAAEF
jgi:NAD(P)H-dependent flavin oxidoreductase YrpB (nitropropane dioxygenase family)